MKGKGALGKQGEDEVCQYLIRHGHTILDRNWRYGHLEIDIVALAPDGIHFVEVKSRMVPVQGRPEEAVNAAKQRKIVAAARRYMAGKGQKVCAGMEIWFDVAAVTFGEGRMELEYFPSAFVPIYV